MYILSAVLHLAVFSLVFFTPGSFSHRTIKGDIYEVNLVEMPASRPGKPAESKVSSPPPAEVKPPPRPEPEQVVEKAAPAKRIPPPVKAPEAEKPVVIAKKTIKPEKPPVEKPKEDPSKLIREALEKVQKKVKAEETNMLDRTFAQLEQKVAAAERQEHLTKALAKIESESKGTGGGGPAFGSPDGTISNRLYEMELRERVKSNWVYPSLSSSDAEKNLEAVFVLRVKSDGKILDSRFKKRSANVLFDQSVLKAIERSDPLPPFPEGYRKTFEEIEITFNLKDLGG